MIGYGLALALTGAAFAAVQWCGLAAAPTLALVFALALVQAVVHFRFFLHIRLGKSSRDDLILILFSAIIIMLMVSGTLVILFQPASADDVARQSDPAAASLRMRSAVADGDGLDSEGGIDAADGRKH